MVHFQLYSTVCERRSEFCIYFLNLYYFPDFFRTRVGVQQIFAYSFLGLASNMQSSAASGGESVERPPSEKIVKTVAHSKHLQICI